jgi:Zn-dependent metalloprotease
MIKSTFLKSSDFITSPKNKSTSDFLKTQFNIPTEYEFRNRIIKGMEGQIREYDDLGYGHERYEQYYNNIKIEHSDIRTHYSNDVLFYVNGEYIDVPYIDISVALSTETAIQKAIEYVGAQKYVWENENATSFDYPHFEIVICRNRFNPADTLFHIAYKIDVFAEMPFSYHDIYVDAQNGNILNSISKIYDYGDEKKRAIGTADTRYSETQEIQTKYNNKKNLYELVDETRNLRTVNLQHLNMYYSVGEVYCERFTFTDDDNYWSAEEYDNEEKDNGALDAHWGAMMTWDFFKNTFNRNGIDRKGARFNLGVHWGYKTWTPDTIPPNPNRDGAMFLCYTNDGIPFYWAIAGDGRNYGDIYTSLEIIAHEFGHGVEIFSSDLEYEGETKSICESLSDIWAACVKNYVNVNNYVTINKPLWLLGEDNDDIVRNMENPKSLNHPNTYQGEFWVDPNSSGSAHINSGVMNHWFYLLSEGGSGTNDLGNYYSVEGIGIEKAAIIVYYAETHWITKGTGYFQARESTINAAIQLNNKEEYCDDAESVRHAWYAVGLGDCTRDIKNYNFDCGETHNINACRIEISKTNVLNATTVNIKAEEYVHITSMYAEPGTNVWIRIEEPKSNLLSIPSSTYKKTASPAPTIPSLSPSINPISTSPFQFTLFPNPNSGSFTIEANFPLTDIAHFKITNLLGVSMYDTKTLFTNYIQLPACPAGIYFVVMILKDGTALRQKMMIER